MSKVAIIGRINVGKSTLFNKLTGQAQAMVSNIPGTTRDLKYAQINWTNKIFGIIDTGGFWVGPEEYKSAKGARYQTAEDIDVAIEKRANQALQASDVVIFVVDTQEGINPQDKKIAKYLRKLKDKKIILTANKADSPAWRHEAHIFYNLGLGKPIIISSTTGSGTGDLLDEIVKYTDKEDILPDNSQVIKVAIVGKPNVGKSSLLNQITGKESAIVSHVAHTTREPNNEMVEYQNKKLLLIDTAGIRRRAKIKLKSLESLGVKMSLNRIRSAEVVLFVIDASQSISQQDMQLARAIEKNFCSTLMVANKFDLLKKQSPLPADFTAQAEKYFYDKFPNISFAPIIFGSAKTGLKVKKILDLILEVHQNAQIKISPNALSKFLKKIIKHMPPPKKRVGFGSKTKIERAFIDNFRQLGVLPPTFECYIGNNQKLPDNYKKYIINQLRQKFDFIGAPIKLIVKYKKDKEGNK